MLEWYTRNQSSISMFIAGWCAMATLDCIGNGNWIFACINAGLVYLNIKLAR